MVKKEIKKQKRDVNEKKDKKIQKSASEKDKIKEIYNKMLLNIKHSGDRTYNSFSEFLNHLKLQPVNVNLKDINKISWNKNSSPLSKVRKLYIKG